VQLSGVTDIAAVTLTRDVRGAPMLLALGAAADSGAAGRRWWRATWADSDWSAATSVGGRSDAGAAVAFADAGGSRLLWLEREPRDPMASRLLTARLASGSARVDTVALTSDQASGFGAAVTSDRLWIVRSQQRDPRTPGFVVRVRTRNARGAWTELPAWGHDEFGCAVAPLSGGRALVASAGEWGLSWVVAAPTGWLQQGRLDTTAWLARSPVFARRSGGGAWLVWTDKTTPHVEGFNGERWLGTRDLTCAHPAGQTFSPTWCAATQDAAAMPVIAWGDRGYDQTNRDCLCVAFPDSAGWPRGEEVPGSDGAFVPAVARDTLGETWVAWVRDRSTDAWVIHSRVTAQAESLTARAGATGTVLGWTLTEPAPGSVWSVWRVSADVGAREVGRVQAGSGSRLRWSESRPPPRGVVRYRVRREALDARDRWESAEVTAGAR
jgi:hypothetical protein